MAKLTLSPAYIESKRIEDIQNSWTSRASMDNWFANNPNDPYTLREIAAGNVLPSKSPSATNSASVIPSVTTSSATTPSANTLSNLSGTGNSFLERDATNLGYQGDLTDTAAMQSFIAAANQAAANVTKPSADTLANLGGTGTAKVADTNVAPTTTQGNSFLERDATNLGYQGDLTDTAAMQSFIAAANQAAANVTKPSADTLANLGGTGTAKVADTGTVIDNTKLNTQGGGSALTTGDASALGTSDINKIPTTGGSALGTSDINKIPTTGGSALSTGDVNKMSTSPAATSPPSTINTGSIPALTTADLTNWYNTRPKGITADQLKTALEGQQTALSGQNTEFLKNWNTSADALKNSILSGVDTKNQAFGTQATQGFMDAFKNFQIPTNQQTGVNLGNYNDNRNAAADQWWSQYVTGRR